MEDALMRNMQKEQERERRRQRDRQRRQSMSVEEREKHLARRRRNYQLRRQRAKTNAQFDQMGRHIGRVGEDMMMVPSNGHQTIVSAPTVGIQCSALVVAAPADSMVVLEVPADKLAKLPRRSRLSHIKHLARSLDDPDGDGLRITSDSIMKWNPTSNCSGSNLPPKGLRLNRLKQLARALNVNADTSKTAGQNDQRKIEVQECELDRNEQEEMYRLVSRTFSRATKEAFATRGCPNVVTEVYYPSLNLCR